MISIFLNVFCVIGQDADNNTIVGVVYESGSGKPLNQVVISDAVSGEYTSTNENGEFTIKSSGKYRKLMVSLPGYFTTSLVIENQKEVVIYLTEINFKSVDQYYVTPTSEYQIKDAVKPVQLIEKSDFESSGIATVDNALAGKVAGMHVVEHSGMPGHNSWINLRGVSSIYGKNEPLVFVDGMIHETRYPLNFLIDGHMFNPLEMVDPDDIVDISVLKSGESALGSAGSNGVVYINTEQNKETSAAIKFNLSGGVSIRSAALDVMDAGQYKSYFTDMLTSQGYTNADINTMYPWLNNGPGAPEYYRYNNNTDWQDEVFKNSGFQKYHLFIKGGDDIATYNISTGYIRQGGPFEGWKYSRYNLRLNGKINITNKFSVVPNTKLSLSDTYLSNMGPSTTINPLMSNLLNPPLAAPYEFNEGGTELAHFDDVGVFNTSNPAAIIVNSLGSGRNIHLISAINAIYKFGPKLSVSNLVGISFNNDRESIFIPDIGVVNNGILRNSPRDMVTEYRSTQNFTTLKYNDMINHVHKIDVNIGLRYMNNLYKNNLAVDYNTPSDDFISLGRGSGFEYLRTSDGDVNGLKWISYFGEFKYNYLDKYYISSSLSYDGVSSLNSEQRYNFYPSVSGAWRLIDNKSSVSSKINDLKLKASWSVSGNMFSPVYKYSDLYYTGRRYTNLSVMVRDYNPNYSMEMEKKSTIDAGFDITMLKKSLLIGLDVYNTTVSNLIINQELPFNYGFTDYFDNGGKLSNRGVELTLNSVSHLSSFDLILGATVAKPMSNVDKLEFIDPETSFLVVKVYDAEYVIMEDNPVVAFYGYKTNGIYNTDQQAGGMIGPGKREMGAGDVIFEEVEVNNRIDDNDKQIIGDPTPDFFGGLTTGLAFDKLEISAFFSYSIGNDIYNYVKSRMMSMESYENQSPDVLTERWVPGKSNATLPRIDYGDLNGNNVFSDRWIEDGSYVKLKELTISYDLSDMINIGNEINVYFSATNLLTLTKYSGYDPETMFVNSPFYLGMDFGKIPHLKTFVVGVKLDL